MGRFFSDEVEQALTYIHYDLRARRGQEGFRLLEQAVDAGDADACCLLARCLYGTGYVWAGHGLPEDLERADRLMRQSVQQGSALGALVFLRCRIAQEPLEEWMPFGDLQEAFDIVLEKARRGEPFCQMVIGSVYFWRDFLRIQQKSREDFSSQMDFEFYMRTNIARCEDWYWSAFRNGFAESGINLYFFYADGVKGYLESQPEKAREVIRFGAEHGYPIYERSYGYSLLGAGKEEEGFRWMKKAYDHGEPEACFYLGYCYELGKGVKRNFSLAAQCYSDGLKTPHNRASCCNHLGAMYYDGRGVPQDYAKAYQLLKWADDQGAGNWAPYYLGACYAYGRRTQQDYGLARKYLEKITGNDPIAFCLLGKLYAEGLGGPEDIAKGVEYFQKAGDLPEAQEELKRYKKTRFGGRWVRR